MLDAAVLVPPGVRDLLLSVADAGLYRPVWQEEIEREAYRAGVRLAIARGSEPATAEQAGRAVLKAMNRAFPDARLPARRWVPLVARMANDAKDRHVLAAAVGAQASHLVTTNLRHFPVRARPPGLSVLSPDAFLLALFDERPSDVVAAVAAMAARHRREPRTVAGLAQMMAAGVHVPRFGQALLRHQQHPG